MKLVIDIDDKTYKMIKDSIFFISGRRGSARTIEYNAFKAIYDGKPLPEGHGRLIDADTLVDGFEDNYEFCEALNATPTMIEADKESAE